MYFKKTSEKTNEDFPYWLIDYEEVYKENPEKASLQWFKDAKFGMFVHLNLYLNRIKGDKFATTLDREQLSYSIKINTSYPVSKKFRLQVSGNYDSPFISGYGKQFEQYYADAGIRAKVIKNKGSLVLKIVDVFNSMEYDKIIN